jgi:hypothetical protein
MHSAPESWTKQLLDEFAWYVAPLVAREGSRYRCTSTGTMVTEREFTQIRDEVITSATTDTTSLAYQMLLKSGTMVHTASPCPTCDAAIRLAWGTSPTRRALGLPPGTDLEPVTPDRVAS